ncbi:MAG: glucose-6-phosphate isomerase, partial [Muribaculaceae bacterium]|nr:glucose-6-phosphate isomerase [Muribaculaceae bacterium]
MKSIEINIQDAVYFAEKQYQGNEAAAVEAMAKLHEGSGEGNDFLGWLNLPSTTSQDLLARINKTAERLRENCDYVVCVDIGGSNIIKKKVISAISDNFADFYGPQPKNPKVLYAGQNIG